MKVVILAGGFGSRISEGSDLKPKPMVEIGGKPILWHIMKYYSSFGFDEFIICLGYMQYVVKEYFADYYLHNSDVEFDLKSNSMKVLDNILFQGNKFHYLNVLCLAALKIKRDKLLSKDYSEIMYALQSFIEEDVNKIFSRVQEIDKYLNENHC